MWAEGRIWECGRYSNHWALSDSSTDGSASDVPHMIYKFVCLGCAMVWSETVKTQSTCPKCSSKYQKSHQISCRSTLMLQLSIRKPANVVSFYSPTKDKDLQLDWWCRDCTGSSTEHHNLTDWSTRSLTNRISPFPPKPLSLPAAHSTLCSFLTTAVHPFQQNGRQHMLTFV